MSLNLFRALQKRRQKAPQIATGMNAERALARGQSARVQLAVAARHPVWAIREDAWQSHLQTMGDTTLAFWWEDDEDEESEESCEYQLTDEGTAIIPIHGVLIDSEPTWWMSYMRYGSTPQIARMVRAAAADANVTQILFHVDSPGGQFSGLADAADAIYQVRQSGEKNTVSFCKNACSASYFLASQASHLWATQDSDTGCIGTLITVRDSSKAYELMGVEVDRITSDGAEEIKGMLTPGTAVTETQKKDLKRIANESQALFNAAIMRGRGMSLTEVSTLANGRWYVGANAVPLKLVDRIVTETDALTLIGAGDLDGKTDPPSGDTANPPGSDPATTQTTQKEQQKPMTWDEFTALIKGTPAPGGAPTPAPAQSQPQNPAAITPAPPAAPADSPELIRLREFEQRTLGAKRTAAKSAAVLAFGQGSDKLARAERSIDALTDPDAIDDMAQLYADQTPVALQGDGNGRRTLGTMLPSGEEGQALSLLASARKADGDSADDDDIKQLRATTRRVSGAPQNVSGNGRTN